MAVGHINMSSLPLYIECEPANCVYYCSKLSHKHFLIFCPNYNKQIVRFIYKYDLATKRCSHLYKYPPDLNLCHHAITINSNNGDLFLFTSCNKLIAIINVESGITKFITNNMLQCIYDNNQRILQQISLSIYPKALSYSFAAQQNNMHCIKTLQHNETSLLHHLTYNPETQSFQMLSELHINHETVWQTTKVIYVEFLNKIMVFVSDQICSLNLDSNSNINGDAEWKINVSNVLQKYGYYERRYFVLGFKYMIFFFSAYQLIECLDLLSDKWYTVNKRFPVHLCANVSLLVSRDNYLYIIKQSEIVKIALDECVPKELYQIYAEYYSNIIHEYIIDNCNKYNINIPLDIHQIIYNFYPIFVSGCDT